MPAPLAALFLGRDVILVTGAFVHRASIVGWRWPGFAQFFRLPTDTQDSNEMQPQDQESMRSSHAAPGSALPQHGSGQPSAEAVPPAPFVEPLYISKVNTVLQLAYVTVCMSSAWCGWPDETAALALGCSAGVTTVVSGVMYVRAYLAGQVLQAK